MEDRIIETLERMVGDIPVSVQLATALDRMASKEDVNALRSDLNALRKEIESLIEAFYNFDTDQVCFYSIFNFFCFQFFFKKKKKIFFK